MHKRTICTIFSILFLTTACTTTDPQPVETAPEMGTAAETQQNGEIAAETQQETETETEPDTEPTPVSDAQITYADVSTWTDSIGSTWYTAVVEVENTGTATIMLSNCSMDVEDASGALVGTMDLGTSVPEFWSRGRSPTSRLLPSSSATCSTPPRCSSPRSSRRSGNHGGSGSEKNLKNFCKTP